MQDARQRAAGTGKVTYTVYDAFGRVIRVGEATAAFADLDPERTYPFERDSVSWRSRMTYDGGDAAGGGANYVQGRLAKVEENTDADATATSREAPRAKASQPDPSPTTPANGSPESTIPAGSP